MKLIGNCARSVRAVSAEWKRHSRMWESLAALQVIVCCFYMTDPITFWISEMRIWDRTMPAICRSNRRTVSGQQCAWREDSNFGFCPTPTEKFMNGNAVHCIQWYRIRIQNIHFKRITIFKKGYIYIYWRYMDLLNYIWPCLGNVCIIQVVCIYILNYMNY